MINKTLEPGAPIGWSLRDDRGRPIQGAEVTVAFGHPSDKPDADLLTPSPGGAHGDLACVRVETDAGGRWRCSSLPANPDPRSVLLLRLAHPDFVSDTGGFRRQLSLRTARAMNHLAWRAVSDTEGRFIWPDAPREEDFAFELREGVALPVDAPVTAKTDRANLTFDPE